MDVVPRGKKIMVLFLLLLFAPLAGVEYYEGTMTFHGYKKVEWSWMVQFLPYNPVIVEVGAYMGKETRAAAESWPYARKIVAFEPNPRAFAELQKNTASFPNVACFPLAASTYNGTALLYLCRGSDGNDAGWEHRSSLLPPTKETAVYTRGPILEVPCVVLDDWCAKNQIDQVDVLRLELDGLELHVLESSPKILKSAKLIILQTFFSPTRTQMVDYFQLKAFLTAAKFRPLAHWYEQGGRGLAVYISDELYDAYFVRCLGLGLGGLLYP
jgi:FkbM family methyltransferase